jgi:hypothetical protein
MTGSWTRFKRRLIGSPIPSAEHEHQLLPKVLALPVFASDALSSVAYATEEVILILALAGALGLGFVLPISGAIALLMIVVVTSYRQTVRAYPQGGGSFLVSHDNLGLRPAMVAAAALLTDYVLTVAVSVSAGMAAITSAAPFLLPHRVLLALGFLVLLTVANLRGARERLSRVPVEDAARKGIELDALLDGVDEALIEADRLNDASKSMAGSRVSVVSPRNRWTPRYSGVISTNERSGSG